MQLPSLISLTTTTTFVLSTITSITFCWGFQNIQTSSSFTTTTHPITAFHSNHYVRIHPYADQKHFDKQYNNKYDKQYQYTSPQSYLHTNLHSSPNTNENNNNNNNNNDNNNLMPGEELPQERKEALFQALLRDLQIEGTPVLGCDADAVHTMNAALWTTMAEISAQDVEQKVCLVMENIPLGALKSFCQDFLVLKGQERLMAYLPELRRFSVSLVGKGVGPAFIIETTTRTEQEVMEKYERMAIEPNLQESKCTQALQSFINRIVIGKEACPYTKSVDMAAYGLEKKGISPGPVAYRFSPSSDAFDAVGTFWTCVCELLGTPQSSISTTMLSLPAIGFGTTPEAHARFSAVMELISRNLCLYRGDSLFGLVHFHPVYDRTQIYPLDKPAYGHLPPHGWLRPILRLNGNINDANSLSDHDLHLNNYQRRSPFTAINILRVDQLDAATGAKSIVDLDLGNGVVEKASGIPTYSRNAIRLAKAGLEELQGGVDSDIAMV